MFKKFREMGKIQRLAEKYDQFSVKFITRLAKFDNTPTNKYLEYIMYGVSTMVDSKPKTETNVIINFLEQIMEFDSLLPHIINKDIYSHFYRDINNFLEVVRIAKKTAFDKLLLKKDSKDIFIVHDTENYILIEPRSILAGQKYGYGTKWCTAVSHSLNRFNQYKGKILYLLAKKNNTVLLSVEKVGITCEHGYYTLYDTENGGTSFIDLVMKGWWDESDVIKIRKECKRFFNRNKFWFIKKHFKDSIRNRRNQIILNEPSIEIEKWMDTFLKS